MSTKKQVISKEIALNEIETLINRFVKKPVKRDEIEETYPDILDAIMDGFLSFDGIGIPVLKLRDPVVTESGSVALDTVNFRTRVKPTTLRDLGKGLDMKKDPFGLGLRITAYITDQPEIMVDNYSKYDYGVIDQICSIFS